VRGRPAIANVIIDQLRRGGSYVAAPQLVMQSGPLALIISGAATSVARAKPGQLALRDQSARPMTCSQPDLRRVPTNESTISLTSFIAQFDRFS
jgi:hypothetical protein